MRKMILILIILILIPICFAYVKPIDYHGVKVKFYDNTANKTKYFEMFDMIPNKYFEGLEYIKIFKPGIHIKYAGFYHVPARGIDLYWWLDLDIMMHELCHHQNYIDGDTLSQISTHGGGFNECIERY